ncbi:phosphopantetheine-binding protein [Peptoniphilus stercorisuis]|uniref:Acyl carrier protein n=1 Tax=Peptoniphilus stercorisuis TaxID=1436965 RepID=A0ABS4KCU3_9FIRM|nr:phosphopantetheine-binding protein [Peptoniphilus stercorisuis]MBP2025577.1 acyl carrier protein [Peptoniphilus stercorisuis]
MKEKLIEILNEVRPDIDYSDDMKLVDDGILDSFDIVNLILEIEEELDVKIGVEDILPENFNNLDDLELLIEELDKE